MVKKDLNLFTVYKKSSSKSGGGHKGVVAIICVFIFIVAAAFGSIQFFIYQLNQQINQLQNELAKPAVVQNKNKLTEEVNRNILMTKYDSAIKLAKKNFDATRFIDSTLLGKITASMPADVVINNIMVTQISISLSCICTDKLAPAIFAQSLNKTKDFDTVTYDGISFNIAQSNYSFNIKCNFKEVTPK